MSGIIKVEDNIEFYYEDSGTNGLDLSNYTTVVFIHGMGFNGAVFRRMFPFASSHNYRLVCPYRRGYTPSTPWTDEEVALYKSADVEDGKKHLRLAGLQIARFLVQFAASQSIPKHNEEQKTGGIILIGWSLGTLYLNATLANVDGLVAEELEALKSYLHAVIYFDTFAVALGIDEPKTIGFKEEYFTLPVPERWAYFQRFVGGFFTHRNRRSRDLADLECSEWHEDRPASLQDITEEEHEKLTSMEMYATHDLGTLIMQPEVIGSANRRALFDVGMAKYLPKVKIRFLVGTEGPGLFLYALHQLEKSLEEGPSVVFGESAERARDIQLTYLERGNHFVFWEEPRWALKQFRACLEG
ncbi:Alpha/Beta hydrolase protein [Scleroderma yunnanense]